MAAARRSATFRSTGSPSSPRGAAGSTARRARLRSLEIGCPLCRSRIRQRDDSKRPASAEHRTGHRSSQRGSRKQPRTSTMGGRANDQLVQRVPPHSRAIQPTHSHSARLERDQRSHHLLPHLARVSFVRANKSFPALSRPLSNPLAGLGNGTLA